MLIRKFNSNCQYPHEVQHRHDNYFQSYVVLTLARTTQTNYMQLNVL